MPKTEKKGGGPQKDRGKQGGREGLAIKQESEGPLWDSRGIEGAREYLEKH